MFSISCSPFLKKLFSVLKSKTGGTKKSGQLSSSNFPEKAAKKPNLS